jgi:hypothetical protein
MKNIAYSLIMTFLFGSFFPSYQAYAKGNNTFATMQKAQLNTKLNDDLVNKLASSKTFEAYYYSLFTLAMYSALSLSNKSEKQLEQVSLQLEQIVDKKDNNNNVYAALGLEVDKAFTLKTDELEIKLKNEFPALTVMDENQIKEVVNRAIVKGDLEAKAMAFGVRDDCFNNAAKEYTKCTTGSKWWSATAAIACGICVAALIACVLVTAFATAGTSAVAFAAALLPYTKICISTTLTMFGLSGQFNTTCDIQNKIRVESCVTAYGVFNGGGAE